MTKLVAWCLELWKFPGVMKNAKHAVNLAITSYAKMLEITPAKARELYLSGDASAQSSIQLLVLAQADPVKLRKLAELTA